MKQNWKRNISMCLVAAMIFSLLAMAAPLMASAAPVFETVGGWNETLYATIAGLADEDVTAVSYSGPVSGSLTGQDFEYLVRKTSGGVRLDILGLIAGTYTLTVETTSGTVTQSGIEVPAQDRSGFAHDGYTQGIGAYNDDGTLKGNALVVYVTNSNKNSVEVTCGGVTVAGIGHILNSAGEDVGGGVTSQGGIANQNAGILQKLADANIPLCVRIIGNVTAPDGVTAYSSLDYGGIKGDSGFMVRMRHCKNITIEGVGASGSIDGWGLSFISASGDTAAGYGIGFEVRNITFDNVPEDCIGFEGTQVGDTLPDPIQRCWAHNNTFNGPYIADAAASDKKNGDGACDWKRGLYYTNSYNYYNAYRKTNLVGSNDDCLQYHATFHHNYWYDCQQRMPLCRQADVHLYNNIWYSTGDYCISPRASSYVFVESSYFDSCDALVDSSGDIDSYNNEFVNCEQDGNSVFHVTTDKASTIAGSELAGTYVEAGDYIVQENIEEMKQVVYTQTGSQRSSGSAALDPDAPADDSASNAPGGFTHNFTLYELDSAVYTFSGGTLYSNKGSVTYNKLTLTKCYVMGTSATVSFNAPVAGSLTMCFGGSTSDKGNKVKLDGVEYTIDANNRLETEIAAGDHTFQPGTQVQLFYISYIPSEEVEEPTIATEAHEHVYTSAVTTQPSCETGGIITYTCTCGEQYTETVAALGHSYENGYCSVCSAADPNGSAHTHAYTAVITAPTCTEQGFTTHTCVCGDSYADTYVAATGHSHTAKITAPTCTDQGYTTHTCACGDTYTDTYVDALGHSYTASVIAPTCTAQGYTLHTCASCGGSYKDSYVDATGHTYVNGKCSSCGRSETVSANILEAAGHLESAYVEWAPVSGADGYNVYVKKTGGSYVQLDNELIRQYPGYMRADAVGLAAGTYILKIVPIVDGAEQTGAAMETDDLTVLAHDRSGYAHSGGYNVGAYNADGTLKSNAKVFYITKDTVNTVTVTEGGKTYTGLGKLVKEYARTTSYPIVIRIIGEIPVPSATTSGNIEVKDNIVPITIEGIGEDATCDRWGFKLSGCENVEVRNLGFMCNASSEGDSLTLQNAVRCWAHNCDFFYGDMSNPEADQTKGDGALDTKHSQYVTHSYNHFWDCGKVNLQGSGSSDTSNYITYHHNWYDHSDSRHPRVRIATVHVYNNYYDGNAGYGIGATLGSDIFVENNYFRNCHHPMLISDQGSDTTETMSGEAGGMIKAYGNHIVGAASFIPYSENNTSFDAYVASSRDEQVPASVVALNGGAGYNNFDTAADFYDYTPDSAQVGAEKAVAYAGRVGGGDFQWEFDDATQDANEEIIPELKAALLAYETSLVSVGGNSVTTPTEPTEPTEPETQPTEPGTEPTEPGHTHSYTASVTAPTCTADGKKVYTCSCGDTYSETVPATGHSYVGGVCSSCGAAQPTVAPSSQYIHNFTENGMESDFYTLSGSLSTASSSYVVSYNGLTLTQYLGMSSSTMVSFNAPADGTLTLVFGKEVAGGSYSIKVGASESSLSTVNLNKQQIFTMDVTAGSFVLKKGSGSAKLFYMVYTPNAVEPEPTEPELYKIPSVSVSVGNTLGMNFWIPESYIASGDYAVVTKNYVGAEATQVTVPQSQWLHMGGYWVIPFNGIAAKEMMDDVTCTIYSADGTQASEPGTSSVRKYADSQLATTNASLKTLLIDMLNYGAAAQEQFTYDTANLANKDLPEADAACGTADIDMNGLGHHAVKGTGMYGGALTLKSSILMNVFFETTTVTSNMTARISYTNYKGNAVSFDITGDQFQAYGSAYLIVNIETLVAADLATVVSIDIYDGETLVSHGEYNMAQYCQSNATTPISIALAKYCQSAKNYLA